MTFHLLGLVGPPRRSTALILVPRVSAYLALITLASCGSVSSVAPTAPSPLGPHALITSVVSMELKESVGPAGGVLLLHAQTGSYMSCGLGIQNQTGRISRLILIELGGIYQQYLACAYWPPSRWPASATINLGNLPDGRYGLNITVRGYVQRAELTVTRDSVVVTNGDGRWTQFPHPVLNRAP